MVDGVNIGRFKDGGIGIRVSQPGYDGDSNPCDQSQLAFSSENAALPIWWQSGNVPFSAGNTTTINFPSTLPYTPFVSCMVTSEGITHVPNVYLDWSAVGGVGAQALAIQVFPGYVTVTAGSAWTSQAPGGAHTATSGTIKITVYRLGIP